MPSGVRASPCMELWPRAPGSSTTRFALNFAIVGALIPFWSGASTSDRIGAMTRSSPCFVASRDIPGLSRPNT